MGKTVGVNGRLEVQARVHVCSGMWHGFGSGPEGMELFSVMAERSVVANVASLLARRLYYIGGSVAVPQKCRLAYLGECSYVNLGVYVWKVFFFFLKLLFIYFLI